MDSNSKIYVAGHRGMVGSAIVRELKREGYDYIITSDRLDLRYQKDVNSWFNLHQPEYVFLAAARVGGIGYNKDYPADFIRDNLLIQTNVIDAANWYGTRKLLFLGSACIYPKHAPVPIKEESLMTGPLEPTNDAYAIAKIAGMRMCRAFTEQNGFSTVSVMPTNLYGPHDNFRLNESHVIPAMIRKFLEAKESNAPEVVLFGTGTVTREFLYVDDLANALVFLMNNYNDPNHINVGTGHEVQIMGLAHMIAAQVGYEGNIVWDSTKPDGTPRRVLDTTKMNDLGWEPKVGLETGLAMTIDWYLRNRETARTD